MSELIRIVKKDLGFLADAWNPSVDDDSLRRGSVILRKLLLEGLLHRAWKANGRTKQPHVIAPRLESLLAKLPNDKLRFALAGGGNFGGVYAAFPCLMEGNDYSHPDMEGEIEHLFSLREFVEGGSLYLEGRTIKRRELIKYVANKLGGAHWDPSRRRGDEAFTILDRNDGVFRMFGKNAIYYELLSIGQLVATSPDIRDCFL